VKVARVAAMPARKWPKRSKTPDLSRFLTPPA